jgi:hypothetical protein
MSDAADQEARRDLSSPPKLGEVESPPPEDVLEGVASKEEVVEHAPSVDEVIGEQPSVDELLGRDR